MTKQIIWAFPGSGKTTIAKEKCVVDVDYNEYIFSEYKESYIDYINGLEEEIVLVNCPVSMLSAFEHVAVVYPASSLKQEFLNRYQKRGNDESFIEYMETAFNEMIEVLQLTDYPRYILTDSSQYLNHILNIEGDIIMAEFLTKEKLEAIIQDAIHYGVFPDTKYLKRKKDIDCGKIAQDIFTGKLPFDVNAVQDAVDKEKTLEEQRTLQAMRLENYSELEAVDIVIDAIAAGVLEVHHGQIYPYTYGYEIRYKKNFLKPGFDNEQPLWSLAENLVKKIMNDEKENIWGSNQKFSYSSISMTELIQKTAERKTKQPKDIIPDIETDYYEERMRNRSSYYAHHHVANYDDLDAAKALDGIIAGKYHGTYSTITTSSHNALMEAMVAFRGYCLDYVHEKKPFPHRNELVAFYAKKGINLDSKTDIEKWIKENPGRCFHEKNRVKEIKESSIDAMMHEAAIKKQKPEKLDKTIPEHQR